LWAGDTSGIIPLFDSRGEDNLATRFDALQYDRNRQCDRAEYRRARPRAIFMFEASSCGDVTSTCLSGVIIAAIQKRSLIINGGFHAFRIVAICNRQSFWFRIVRARDFCRRQEASAGCAGSGDLRSSW
jgi:hypothetical protein